MWSIYSIGDAAYMERVLNAVAMITGTGEFSVMARIGMLVGMLLVVLQGMAQGGRGVNIGAIFVSWLVFMTMYGPATTVTIEDGYTGQVRVVANVPIGVAAIGSTISQLGYGTTDLFETAFSLPSVTRNGFASALETLKSVRKVTWDSIGYGYANDASKAGRYNLEQSWINYIMECTIHGIKTGWPTASGGTMSHAAIQTADSLIAALQYTNPEKYTSITIDGDKLVPCPTAYNTLVQYTTGQFYTDLLPYSIAPALQMRTTDPAADGAHAEDRVNNALADLGFSSITAKDYIIASTLEPLYHRAWAGEASVDQEHPYAITINDAVRQRNAQWEAEADLFTRTIRPMITFIEGFVFSVTPFMALIIVMGPFGISLAGRYLLLLFWIQLWYPILAICNLYIMMTVQAKMAAFAGASSKITLLSLAGLEGGDKLIQQYLATGQMLAASTPGLALMLVYGSAVTATSFVSRMQGGDFVDEKKVAPDTMSSVPMLAREAMQKGNAVGGHSLAGAPQVMGDYMFADTKGADISSAHREASSAQEAFSNTYANNLSGYIRSATSGRLSESVSDSGTIGTGQSSSMLMSKVHDIVDAYKGQLGLSEAQTKALTHSLGGQAAAKVPFAAAVGEIKNSNTGQTADQKSKTLEFARAIHERVSGDEQFSASFMKQWRSDVAGGKDFTSQSGKDVTDQQTFQHAAQEAISKEDAFTETATSAVRAGEQLTLSKHTAVNLGTAHAPTRNAITNYVDNMGLRPAVNKLFDRFGSYWGAKLGLNKEQQWTYAALQTITGENTNYATMSEGQKAEGLAFLGQLYGGNPAARRAEYGNAGANKGIFNRGIDSALSSMVLDAKQGSYAPGSRFSVEGDHKQRMQSVDNRIARGTAQAAEDNYDPVVNGQGQKRAEAARSILLRQRDDARQRLLEIQGPREAGSDFLPTPLKGQEREAALEKQAALGLQHGLTPDQAEYFALKSVGADGTRLGYEGAQASYNTRLKELQAKIGDKAVVYALNTAARKAGFISPDNPFWKEPNLEIVGQYNRADDALNKNYAARGVSRPDLPGHGPEAVSAGAHANTPQGRSGHGGNREQASPQRIALDKNDHEALVRLMLAEAGGEGRNGMAGVAYTVLNRLAARPVGADGKWSAQDIVEEDKQFEPVGAAGGDWRNLPRGSESDRRLAASVLEDIASGRMSDPTRGSTYFLNRDVAAARGTDFAASRKDHVRTVIGKHTYLGPSAFSEQPEVPAYTVSLPGAETAANATKHTDRTPVAGRLVGEASAVPEKPNRVPSSPTVAANDTTAPSHLSGSERNREAFANTSDSRGDDVSRPSLEGRDKPSSTHPSTMPIGSVGSGAPPNAATAEGTPPPSPLPPNGSASPQMTAKPPFPPLQPTKANPRPAAPAYPPIRSAPTTAPAAASTGGKFR
ncbi:conjugal transfer protein TraG N-terminal domain-containing protein [Azospirillum sp. sgz302134]